MSELRELKNESTLSGICQDPENNNHALLFGIIIDISEPYKSGDSTNYTTKLKIIDPSFNYKADLSNPKLKFHKFVHVNIYSETPEKAPRIQYVGDIIRLRRFKFKFTPKSELIGNMQKYSNWLIYSGKISNKADSLVSQCYKNYTKNKNRLLNNYEKGRLSDLRNWNDSFFFQNSLKYITWWTNSKGNQSCKKVDLILKCDSIDYKIKTLKFVDEEKNEYLLQLKAKPNKIENEVIKLRCVNVNIKSGKARVIKLTELSSCLLIPKYFYDARRFEKILPGKKSVSKSYETLSKKFPYLKKYNLTTSTKKNQKTVSVVKNTLNNKDPINLKDLKKNLESKKHLNEKFVISGYIMGIMETSPTKVIKKLCVNTMKVTDLKEKEKKGTKYRTIYNLIMMIKDESMKKKDEYITVYLTTESGDLRLFESWELLPNSDDSKKWEKVKNKQLKEFEKKLKGLINPSYRVNLGIQVLKTKTGKQFLKVVDTVFLPM